MNIKKKKQKILLNLFSFTSHHKHLLLNMFFENGEYARKVLEPIIDNVIENE
jgi:hypothetical protein